MIACGGCRLENDDGATRCAGCGALLRGARGTGKFVREAIPLPAPAPAAAEPPAPPPAARPPAPPLERRPAPAAGGPGGTERGPRPGRPAGPPRTRALQRPVPPPPAPARAPGPEAHTPTRPYPPRSGGPPIPPPRQARPRPGTPVGWLCCDPFPPQALAAGSEVVIGRTDPADLVLPHPSISRQQAVVRAVPGGVELEDRSSFGTWVNGEKVEGRRQLAAGDLISMGPYEMTFTTTRPAESDQGESTREFERAPLEAPPPEPAPEPAPPPGPRPGAASVAGVRSGMFYGRYGASANLIRDEQDDEAVVGRPLPEGAPRQLQGKSGRTYALQAELGRGAFGVAYLAAVEGEQRFAGFQKPVEVAVIKMALPGAPPAAREALAREREVYSHPDPGLVNLLDAGEAAGCPFLVLERLYPHPFSRGGGSALDPATAVDTFVNLLEVLHRLHTRREAPLVLCDIKPENLMVRLSNKQGRVNAAEWERRLHGKAYEPVFMDMGCAQERGLLAATAGKLKDVVGTPLYLPPEALPRLGEGSGFIPGVYGDKVDVYALTLTLYQLLTGDRPYATSGLWDLKGDDQLVAILELKRQRGATPWRADQLERRFGQGDAAAVVEVLEAGLHPSPELRLSARDLLRLSKKVFQVGETRVLTLSEYAFDAVHGIHLEQRRFAQGWERWS